MIPSFLNHSKTKTVSIKEILGEEGLAPEDISPKWVRRRGLPGCLDVRPSEIDSYAIPEVIIIFTYPLK